MSLRLRLLRIGGWLTAGFATVLLAGSAVASTVTQNSSWTIDRAGTSTKYRVTAYGDSIYAGYYGSISRVAKRAAPGVDGEYLQKLWNSDIQVIRRTKSGAVAKDIYDNKIVNEKSYMQTADTRVVSFEMCGNDFLQARSSFKNQTGTCNFSGIDTAMANCTNYQQKAMQYINANAHANTKLKVVANVYYPGYDADNTQSSCTVNGSTINMRDMFLPYLAKSNWRACDFARQNGFQCADSFAQYMGADFDTNGDGLVDSDGDRVPAGRERGELREPHHGNAEVDPPRCELQADHVVDDGGLHPVGQHPPDLPGQHDLRRAVRRDGLDDHRAGLLGRQHRGREEPGLEPARARADGLGAVGLQSLGSVAGDRRSRPGAATGEGTRVPSPVS